MLPRRLLLAALASLCLTGPAPAQTGNISGVYQAQGRNPDGSRYSGTVTVQETAQGAVSFAWIVGGRHYAGSGQRAGAVVSVNWGDTHPVVYVVMSDGSLHGTWANGQALERLSR